MIYGTLGLVRHLHKKGNVKKNECFVFLDLFIASGILDVFIPSTSSCPKGQEIHSVLLPVMFISSLSSGIINRLHTNEKMKETPTLCTVAMY